jgi:hypothetical protein
MESHMDFHKVWQEQCEATRPIRERFGVKNALDYLVGEKLLTFARAADEDSEFAAELPRFQAAVWEIFNPYELRGYVASLKPAARKKLQKLLTFLCKRLRLSGTSKSSDRSLSARQFPFLSSQFRSHSRESMAHLSGWL